jgi:ATP-dependent helicase/nuclease subunit B
LPYAQLRPLAARLWAQAYPDGFAPRFETTKSWSTALGHLSPDPTDLSFDMALDSLTAQALVARAGLSAHSGALVGLLIQSAQQLAPCAAAQAPPLRDSWAQHARQGVALGAPGDVLQLESAVARIAVEWAAQSSYASDVLFDAELVSRMDCLVLVQGLMPDPMAQGLVSAWGEKLSVMPLVSDQFATTAPGALSTHACRESEDEAQRAAACAIAHIEAGRFPVALVSSDRALTRRVRAMLDGAGVQIRDENGWKLSTSAAAAGLMAALNACQWNASADAVLGWLKLAPALAEGLEALESALRRDQVRDWRNASRSPALKKSGSAVAVHHQADALRTDLQGRHTVVSWLVKLRTLLDASGMFVALQSDGAGAQVLLVLRLAVHQTTELGALAATALWGQRRLDLSEFTQWVNEVLEAANFQPAYPHNEEVVILPMSQMLARPFAALVIAGCDEVRLNPSPEPTGAWTPVQRLALGLPSRADAEQALRASWRYALQTPVCDVLWRTADDAGETLLPSTLVQWLQWQNPAVPPAIDPRPTRLLAQLPVARPLPTGAALPLRYWTQGAFDDLRQCPYRFFAMRQLGLRSADELESEVDKRDFGLWLHEVLQRFHVELHATQANAPAAQTTAADPTLTEALARRDLLNRAAAATTEALGLPEGEFLPFSAAWPAVRDGYLVWLADHEKTGARFVSGETAHTQALGELSLLGRVDRMDCSADGQTLVLDYKTENIAKTRSRVKDPFEDTQIAFYAALLPDDTLRGGYINVAERGGTELVEQKSLVEARDALIENLLADAERIAQGATLPALGDGAACDFCQARGLCRKDFWSAA